MIDLSIIIPTYNRKSLTLEAVESALKARWPAVEVLVGDNGSDDGTVDELRKYFSKVPNFEILESSKNLGPVSNWRRLANHARGSYTKILFSDDLIINNSLIEQFQFLSVRDDCAFVYSPSIIGDGIGSPSLKEAFSLSVENSTLLSYIWVNLYKLSVSVPKSPGCALLRTCDVRKNLFSRIDSIGLDFSNTGAGADILLLLMTAMSYKTVGFVATPGQFFRSHPGSITVKDNASLLPSVYTSAIQWFFENMKKDVAGQSYFDLSCLGNSGDLK